MDDQPTISSLGVSESLCQVKLLAALRNGDVTLIHQLLTEPEKQEREVGGESVDIGAAAVHLAIRCASSETVSLLLSHRLISPNAVYPSGSGTTALHLAASIGRADVVNRLLEQERIDDTLRDSHGRTCLDVARNKEVRKIIRDSRALLTASYCSLLHSYIASPMTQGPPQALLDILDSPRVKLVDLSYLDPTSGRSLLHEAAIRKDIPLIDKSIKAGADIFVRDRRGKAVGEYAGKDDGVRALLRQFANYDSSLLSQPSSSSEPPTLKGYLMKYTNVARGYSTRWFVLKNGILSYYRHQDNESFTSRGSISTKSAILVYDEKLENLRFEVHSNPGHGQQKWYLKGNYPIEVSRWIQAIRRCIERSRREASGSESDSRSAKSRGSSTTKVTVASSLRGTSTMKEAGVFAMPTTGSAKQSVSHAAVAENDESEDEDEGKGGQVTDDSSTTRSERGIPHEAEYELHGNATAAQAELSVQLLSSLVLPVDAPEALHKIKKTLDESVCSTALMINEHLRIMAEREEWWRDALARERQRGSLWEETLQTVVQEGAALESALKSRMRRPSRTRAASTDSADQKGSSLRGMPGFRLNLSASSYKDNQALAEAEVLVAPETEQDVPAPVFHEGGDEEPERLLSTMSRASQAESAIDTDEEDEFFDAIESNALPNVVVPTALSQMPAAETPATIAPEQYDGYANLRVELGIGQDTRPPTSLWSVLKHSIGKDLTRISFPVFFNEPTSMLQRMAEDMEFSECLDAASVEPNPHMRIAFVAAFAMSNYSSTIGRIAKPFNPMLGETFEYVRLDKKYRYMSEQVSHHPPISACWAESPCWHYFGEIDAQNKFMGKSFEIRPTGVAHAKLLIPEKFGDESYPKARPQIGQGKVIEHYSWKKVTTNVSGFILGSPTIDHYGDMTVVNHRTGDTCVLSFKPRGWRGKDAYEILGRVMDRNGNVAYEIAGRWNSQLVARAVGTKFGDLQPDVSVYEKHESSSSSLSPPPTPMSSSGEYTVLWRNTVKPSSPFNLTPFAITLNDLPPALRPCLPPTDCRLRPDQRAFELGMYEHANRLKLKQEDLQRATRRAREEGRIEPHRPRWFEARVEPETGERVWEPARLEKGDLEYWAEREAVWRDGRSWTNVDSIFIHDEP